MKWKNLMRCATQPMIAMLPSPPSFGGCSFAYSRASPKAKSQRRLCRTPLLCLLLPGAGVLNDRHPACLAVLCPVGTSPCATSSQVASTLVLDLVLAINLPPACAERTCLCRRPRRLLPVWSGDAPPLRCRCCGFLFSRWLPRVIYAAVLSDLASG